MYGQMETIFGKRRKPISIRMYKTSLNTFMIFSIKYSDSNYYESQENIFSL